MKRRGFYTWPDVINTLSKRVFKLLRKETAAGWKELHSEFLSCYSLQNVCRIIKPIWAGKLWKLEEMRNMY
jgi:hypothetical protein